MSKKNKVKHSKSKKTVKQKTFNWNKFVKRFFISLSFIGVISIPIIVYGYKAKIEHDLSVIGNGTATVVQIHDPNCQLCQQLKNNVDSVKGEFKENIQFKTANIKSAKGKAFAGKHNVPHVTLLFFDPRGNKVNTLQGVTPKKDIQKALASLNRQRKN